MLTHSIIIQNQIAIFRTAVLKSLSSIYKGSFMPGPIIPNQSIDSSFRNTLISGAGGGGLGGIFCFPFEGLKKLFQTGALVPHDIIELNNGKFLKALHPLELYRGSSAFSTAVMVASTTSMTFNRLIQKIPGYNRESKTHGLLAAISSGMLGAIVGSTPVENTILTQQTLKSGPITAIRHMLKQGITRPWAGLPELMIREAGFTGVMLFAGPAAKKYVYEKTESKTLSNTGALAAGGAGALLTQPADTLATYRQQRDGKIPIKDAIREMYSESGAKRFYKGAVPRIILFTGCSITIPYFAKKICNILEE